MAIKKRTTLRSKSTKKSTTPLVKQDETTKEKVLNKAIEKNITRRPIATTQTTLISNSVIPESLDPNQPGISKSAIKRRKRKLRDQIRPKFTEDMLDALTTSTGTTIEKSEDGTQEKITIESKVKLDHTPNPFNKRGEAALNKIENQRFKQVMKNKELMSGGVGSLKEAILFNMNNNNNLARQ